MRFEIISENNLYLLHVFLNALGETGKISFRYFNKRPVEIVLKHDLAVLMLDEENCPLAYGHLEKDGENLWLGIAVSEVQRGKGIGRKMMKYLITFAEKNEIKQIDLTVDNENYKAINLYEKIGFQKIKMKNDYIQYQLLLK